MRRSQQVILLAISLVLFWWPQARAAEPDAVAQDEQLLKSANVRTDGPTLLEFFRKRTLTDDTRKRIQDLIQKLGDDSFHVRERASADLVGFGTVAGPFLRQATKETSDLEVIRRAEACLEQIGGGTSVAVPAAAARLLAVRKPADTVPVLLAYLPFADSDTVADEIRSALTAVAVRDGKPDPTLLAALTNGLALRRAVAAEALWRAGAADAKPAVRKLLQDPEPLVRLRVSLMLARAREKDAVPMLIDLLARLPQADVWQVEDFLNALAEDKGPAVSLGVDEASRKKCRDAWADWWRDNGSKVDLAKLDKAPPQMGYTIVVLLDAGRVIELGRDRKPRWQIEGLGFPLDVQMLPSDRLLIAEQSSNRVTERDHKGQILWEKKVEAPIMAQRLPNGNTLVATQLQIVETDRAVKEVFTHNSANGEFIMRVQKLRNGDLAYVLSDGNQSRFVRLSPAGKELQTFPVQVRTSGGRIEVLPNGNLLVPELNNNRVVELGKDGKPVWQAAVQQPIAAVRLANGNTLITSMNQQRAVEIDRQGKEVWEYKSDTRVTRAYRR